MYHAKSLTRKVGLNYKTIHACPNVCILFWGVYVDLATCLKCGQARFKDVGQSKLPIKVLRHFPLIPHLKLMFKAPVISELMVWHRDNKNTDGLVRHVANNEAWAHIDALWLEFATKPHNVRLWLVADGVIPYGEKNSSWSTWPILLSIYNLPPWFVTKKFFVVLTLLILGKEYVKMHNFDVYIQPLMGELQELWKGVAAYDVLKAKGQRHFTL
jgi:hypothetical protein